MGIFFDRLLRSSDPTNPKEARKFSDPVAAAMDERSRGGDWTSMLGAALDPGELITDNRTQTPEESAAWLAQAKAKAKKKKRYFGGGKTTVSEPRKSTKSPSKCGVGGYYRKR